MAAFDSAQIRAICEWARELARSVPAALRDPRTRTLVGSASTR